MNYIDKYFKYKTKYLNLLNKINANGGMANWDINNNLVTQISENNFYKTTKNIIMDKNWFKNLNYDTNEKIIKIKNEIENLIFLYNIENTIKNTDEKRKKQLIDVLKNTLQYYKKILNKNITIKNINDINNNLDGFNKKILSDEEQLESKIIINNKLYIEANNKAVEIFNNFNLEKQRKILLEVLNNLYDQEREIYNIKNNLIDKEDYLKQKYFCYERGNICEEWIVNNPIILQNYTGDFSEYKSSKNIYAFNIDIQNIFLLELNLTLQECENILKYFPIDAISNKTLVEIKSFSTNPFVNEYSLYNKSKLFGYTKYDTKIIISENKIFSGNISYNLKYINISDNFNNIIKIENIILSINGIIKDNNNIMLKEIKIINKPMLINNNYDYIWIEINSNYILMKNAIDIKYFNKINTQNEYSSEYFNFLMNNTNEQLINNILINRNIESNTFKNELLEDLEENILENKITTIQYNYIKNNIHNIILNKNNITLNKNTEIYNLLKDTLFNPSYITPTERNILKTYQMDKIKILNNNFKINGKYVLDNKIKNNYSDMVFYPIF